MSHADFGRIGLKHMEKELVESRRVIEARLGIRPTSFAIPLGQAANWTAAAQRAAGAAGYETVYAQAGARRPIGTVARTSVSRFDDGRIFQAALRGAFDRGDVRV